MAKRYPAHRVKIHRNYTIEETADLLGAHAQTVRSWVQSGALSACSDKRPVLIVGADLRAFLQGREIAAKRRLGPNEFYCLKCRAPRRPAGMMADFEVQTDRASRLVALCEECEGLIYRAVAAEKLAAVAPNLSLIFKGRKLSLGDPAEAACRTHFDKD
ncbi:MAG: helix-turn-helix domain-containing protein [Amphiplicatus sp.]